MKVVIDTNVALSGLLWEGPPNKILRWARDKALSILGCKKTVEELRMVLGYRRFTKRLEDLGVERKDVLAYFLKLVFLSPNPKSIPGIIEADPFDNLFLGLAAENNASLIVSGDKHLLDLISFNNIQIVTPREAVEVIMRLEEG